jgi:hypothetical protein
MVIHISQPVTKEKLDKAFSMIKEKPEKGTHKGVSKHFGALKRGLDGLAYQKEVRNEWT